MRNATVALVERLQGDSLPPERVLIALKTAIARHGRNHLLPSLTDAADVIAPIRRCEVYRLVFAWYLERYFTETTLAPPSGSPF